MVSLHFIFIIFDNLAPPFVQQLTVSSSFPPPIFRGTYHELPPPPPPPPSPLHPSTCSQVLWAVW